MCSLAHAPNLTGGVAEISLSYELLVGSTVELVGGLKSSCAHIREAHWGYLIGKFQPRLREDTRRSLYKRQLSDRHVDVIEHETWVTAYLRIHSFTLHEEGTEEQLYRWIRVIAKNKVLELAKGNWRETPLDTTDWDASDETVTETKQDKILLKHGAVAQSAEEAAINQELIEDLADAMSILSAREQEIVTLCIIEDRKPSEIASQFGLTPRSVSKLLWRTTKKLRAILDVPTE